jgi:hypothetical protein
MATLWSDSTLLAGSTGMTQRASMSVSIGSLGLGFIGA